MTFKDYKNATLDEQLFIYEACRASKLPEVDCTGWTWGQVKFTQDEIQGSVEYDTLLKIVQFETKLNQYSDAERVISFYLAIVESIKAISEMEASATEYQPTAKEVAAAQEVGGFDVFGTLPQTLRLVPILGCSKEQVEATSYNTAFATMVYNSRLNDFQQKAIKV